ncbi:uncharacterized protein LOC143485021 isoform X2 [Brachyhypopomus gauderio]|uniref:uncharacterized protein LOC143485021 isoform X2 n=1 Tax=Brachyhypopomus gauderio TaxID=698409 RepID=UPI004043095B
MIGGPKIRPASMDLLLLHNRRSTSDLRPPPSIRQLPRVPTTPEAKEREHTYSEVGLLSTAPPRCPDDGLYESVGVRGLPPDPVTSPSAPPTTAAATDVPAQSPTRGPGTDDHGRGGPGDEAGAAEKGGVTETSQESVTAEYAFVRKGRKLERWKREYGSEETEREAPGVSGSDSSAGTVPRKTLEPFHMPNFPKEAVFMGNGEQYIWKPPEENNIVISRGPSLENGQSNPCTAEISEMYSTVCKTLKKKTQLQQQANGQTGSGPSLRAEETSGVSQAWPPGGALGEEARDRSCSQEEHCYEAVGEKSWPRAEVEPAYATLDAHRKREKLASNTLNPKKKNPGQTQGPGRALTCENFYESIGDMRDGANTTSTTTIFTFNDGMEMYVTGL